MQHHSTVQFLPSNSAQMSLFWTFNNIRPLHCSLPTWTWFTVIDPLYLTSLYQLLLCATLTSHQPGSHQGCSTSHINQGFRFCSFYCDIYNLQVLMLCQCYWHYNSPLPISLGKKSDNMSLLSASIASHRRLWLFFALSQHVHATVLKTLSAESAALPCSQSIVSLTLCYNPYALEFFCPIYY